MAEVGLFNAFGVAPCPQQAGRELSEKCWNGAHRTCETVACKCLCHEPGQNRRKHPKAERAAMEFDSAGTIQV